MHHLQITILITSLRPVFSAHGTVAPEKFLLSPVPAIQELKNLYCCNIPDNMMDRNLLLAHFQQFGHVVRIYLSMKRNSCTVHFESHVSNVGLAFPFVFPCAFKIIINSSRKLC
jgi:hypothetical protein